MHPPTRHTAGWRRRVLTLTLGVFALLVSAATPALAVDPIYLEETPIPRRTASPEPDRTTAPASTRAPSPAPAPTLTRDATGPGLDVSYPQCGRELPESFSFAIVGVNGGRVLSINPCLGPGGDDPSLLEWAGPDAELYANTGNPGPGRSRHWPGGQTTPRACNTRANPGNDTADCSYVYGWNAAAHSYAAALAAYVDLGWADADADRLPGDPTWWLDVETANSWRLDRALNVVTLQGAVDYLESMGVTEVGFYSTPLLWWWITGGTDAFAEHPAWHAGARNLADAQDRCDGNAFTGGELRMVQWVENNLDHNHRCS